MARAIADNTHSRVVAWLKIVLPLLALGILSTLFLVSRTIDPEDAIPYAEVDVADRLREPRMTAPSYAGMTADGASLTLQATEARPGAEGNGGGAVLLTGVLETPDGARSDMTAGAAELDAAGRQIVLSGGVALRSSSGFNITSDRLTAALDRTDVQSPGPVTATGPLGTLTAGTMRLTQADTTGEAPYLLVFNSGVKLVYQPAN